MFLMSTPSSLALINANGSTKVPKYIIIYYVITMFLSNNDSATTPNTRLQDHFISVCPSGKSWGRKRAAEAPVCITSSSGLQPNDQ